MNHTKNCILNWARKLGTTWLPTILGALLTTALTGYQVPTFAATDSKILPATVCQAWVTMALNTWDAEVSEMRNSIRYSVNGRIENANLTKPLTVVCPLVRDTVASRLNWLRVFFRDNHPGDGVNESGAVRCRIRANNPQGTGHVAEDFDHSIAGNADSLDGDFEMGLNAASADGSYTLTCVIPPVFNGVRSSIGSIVIEEP